MDRITQDKICLDRKDCRGFTLIELMVAMVLALIVSIGIYRAYISQHKSYVIQERAVEMQQSLRSAILLLEKDLRMAGYDPEETGEFRLENVTQSSMEFTYDRDSDGTLVKGDETFIYELYGSDLTKLHRMSGGSAIAYHVEELQFAYAYDADGDNSIDKAGGEIIWGVPGGTIGSTWVNLDMNNDGEINESDTPGGVSAGTAMNESDIRAVKVWLLVRSSGSDRAYTNTNTYVVGAKHITPNDHFRRRLATTTIQLRNIGL